jgi:phage-related protein
MIFPATDQTCYRRFVRVFYYQSAAGTVPVLSYLLALPVQDSAPIFALVKAIGAYGLEIADHRHIRGKLWELRPDRHRIFYAVLQGDVWLLHAYKKQGAKAPPREIKIALRQLKEIDK